VQDTQQIKGASNSIQAKVSEISKGGQIVWKFPKKVEKILEFPQNRTFHPKYLNGGSNGTKIPDERFQNVSYTSKVCPLFLQFS